MKMININGKPTPTAAKQPQSPPLVSWGWFFSSLIEQR